MLHFAQEIRNGIQKINNKLKLQEEVLNCFEMMVRSIIKNFRPYWENFIDAFFTADFLQAAKMCQAWVTRCRKTLLR